MPDELDRVQAITELHLQNAIDTHARRPVSAGLSNCEDVECGEPITAQRQEMGARLCIDCQRAEEARAAHFRSWRGGR